MPLCLFLRKQGKMSASISPFLRLPKHIDMPAGFAVGVVVIVRAEPVDEIAFGDHVLLQQRQRLQLPHANPLADGAAIIACEVSTAAATSITSGSAASLLS